MRDLTAVNPECRELAELIEKFLEERRNDRKRERRYWKRADEVRNWTYTQFRESVYTTYPKVLKGEIKRPPPRDVVMNIASYFECTVEERNQFLRSAGYAQIPMYNDREELQVAMDIGRDVIQYTPLPAYVINRDWDIYLVNAYLLKMMGLTPEEYHNVPQTQRNIIQIIFDDTLPIRSRLEVDRESWEYIAQRNIFGFKYENQFCDYEDWYKERINRWMKLPDFEDYWELVDIDMAVEHEGDMDSFPFYTTKMETVAGLIRFRSLLASFGNYEYPQVVSYLPVDEESRAVYRRLGFPLIDPCEIYE
jgi:hypothetical protein